MAERAHAAFIDVTTGPARATKPRDPLCLRLRQVILGLAILCHPVAVLQAQPEAAGQQQSAVTEESRLRQNLEIAIQRSGGRGPEVFKAQRALATYYRTRFRPTDAVLHLRELLAMIQPNQSEAPQTAALLLELADQERIAGDMKPALDHATSAWKIYLKHFGDGDNRSLNAAIQTGMITRIMPGQRAEGIRILESAYAQGQATLGSNHLVTANAAWRLALAYNAAGRIAEAEPLYESAAKVANPVNNPAMYGGVQCDLARLYLATGHLNEAEHSAQLAIATYLARIGPQFPATIPCMRVLMDTLIDARRYTEATKVAEQALEYARQMPNRRELVADLTSDLARIHARNRRNADAELLAREAMRIYEEIGRRDSGGYATAALRLAIALRVSGRVDEARNMLAINENFYARLPSVNPTTMAFLRSNQGNLETAARNYAAAAKYYEQAVELFTKLRGPDHPDTLAEISNLGNAYQAQGNIGAALENYRKALAGLVNYLGQRTAQSPDARAEQESNLRGILTRHLGLVVQQRGKPLPDGGNAVEESFVVGEQLRNRALQAAIMAMSARIAVRDPDLGVLVRREQDLRIERGGLESAFAETFGAGSGTEQRLEAQELIKRRTAIDRELGEVTRQITQRFPEYVRLLNPGAPNPRETMNLLAPNEAMLCYLVQDNSILLWIITRDSLRLVVLPIRRDELQSGIRQLRRSLDVSVERTSDLPAYNVTLAHELYRLLIAPAAKEIAGRANLVIVPHGPLMSLPFAALITEAIAQPSPGVVPFAEYRDVPWLSGKHSITIVPSATVWTTLRQRKRDTGARQPLIGFGNPSFSAPVAAASAIVQRNLKDTRDLRALPPLPETDRELRSIAQALGADDRHLYLAERASETNVKSAVLDRYRVVAFATHGLIAGDLDGLTEPALALTPPAKPTPLDDGLLTMSEILGLKLNADWVVLSACNTAAADGSLAGEGLTGLAQAFFYAGSSALLVSLWAVESYSTEALTTTLFRAARDNPRLTRAQALGAARQQLLRGPGSMQNNREAFAYAHPFFWAAFILVGEGGEN